MNRIKNFDAFVNENNSNEWLDIKPLGKQEMVELALELEYEQNGPYTVAEVDALREEYQKKQDKDLLGMIAQTLDCEADEDSIVGALIQQYPEGYILHDNNDFHQNGGTIDDDFEDEDGNGEEDSMNEAKTISFENADDDQILTCAKFAGLDEIPSLKRHLEGMLTPEGKTAIVKELKAMGYTKVDTSNPNFTKPI